MPASLSRLKKTITVAMSGNEKHANAYQSNQGDLAPKNRNDHAQLSASCAKNKIMAAAGIALAPHEPGGNRHHHIKRCPHRAKQPVRWLPCRLVEGWVPLDHCRSRDPSAKRTDGKAERNEA